MAAVGIMWSEATKPLPLISVVTIERATAREEERTYTVRVTVRVIHVENCCYVFCLSAL